VVYWPAPAQSALLRWPLVGPQRRRNLRRMRSSAARRARSPRRRATGRRGHPSIYPDPDVIVIDPAFNTVRLGNAAIRRLWTSANWAEGPAWSSQGQYLVFSDVTGNIQYRYIWEDGRVTPVPQTLRHHQRQLLRPSRPATLLPGFFPARRALGA